MAVRRQNIDVLVIGGGMVGLATAVALAQKGFAVEVWEKNVWSIQCPTSYQPRVSALTRATETFLQALGAWSQIPEARRGAYRHMRVWQESPAVSITFSARDLAEPNLGHIVENEVIRWALYQVAQASGVRLRAGCTIKRIVNDVDCVLAEDSHGQQACASVLIATDGGHSLVREMLGVATQAMPYHQSAFVALVAAERGFQRCAWQRFLPTGPLAFLPLTGSEPAARRGALASIVWTVDDHEVSERKQWSPEQWARALTEASQNQFGRVTLQSDVFVFPLVSRHAYRYFDGRVVLAGDAAHTIHPLAGQGVNLGFADVRSLVGWLSKGLQEAPEYIGSFLQAYENERMGQNEKMRQAMTWIGKLFKAPSVLLEPGMIALQKFPYLRQKMARLALYGA